MARRTTVTATIYDSEGFVFITFKGNAQDVADCCAIYVMNVANPLGGTEFSDIEIVHRRETEEEGP